MNTDMATLRFQLLILQLISVINEASGSDDCTVRRRTPQPLIVISFIIRDHGFSLPYFLGAIERLEYPKSRISLWIRTKPGKGDDEISSMIQQWLLFNAFRYHSVNYKRECQTFEYLKDNDQSYCSELSRSSENRLDDFWYQQEALEDSRRMKADFLFIIKPNVILTCLSVIKDLMLHEDMAFVGPKIECTTWDNSNVDLMRLSEMVYHLRGIGFDQHSIIEKKIVEVLALKHAVLINLGLQGSKNLIFHDPDDISLHKPSDNFVIFWDNIRKYENRIHQDNSQIFGFTYMDSSSDGTETAFQNFIHLKLQVMFEVTRYDQKQLLPSKTYRVTQPPKTRLGFDKIYLINLARRKDRLKKMEYCFDELGIEVSRFEAIDGQSLNQSVLEKMKIKELNDYLDPFSHRPLKLGEVGCFLSHYMIWQDIVRNGFEKVLIFEDDIRFRPNFKWKLQKVMTQLKSVYPKWELFYLGRKILMPSKERETVSVHVVLPSYSYWTLGYAINSEGAKKLVDEKPLSKMVALDEYLSIMFDEHPNEKWKKSFSTRTLMAASANPLLVDPVGIGSLYDSDTESSDVISNEESRK